MTYDPNQPRDRGRFARKPSSDPGTDIGLSDGEIYVGRTRTDDTGTRAELWLRSGDECIAFMKIHRSEAGLVLCDIEVNPAHRGRGVATRFISSIEDRFGEQVFTTGQYTQQGHDAFAHRLPVHPDDRRTPDDSGAVTCGPMSFVSNWRSGRPRYPL